MHNIENIIMLSFNYKIHLMLIILYLFITLLSEPFSYGK